MELTNMLHRQEVQRRVQALFADPENRKCLLCSNLSREWASPNNAIFLCLNCAGACKDFNPQILKVKSVTLDLWTDAQMNLLRKGGNQRFRLFMEKYNLNKVTFQNRLSSRAAVYYRRMIKNQAQDILEIPEIQQPSLEEGKKLMYFEPKKPKNTNQNDDFFDVAKEKLQKAYDVTKQFTVKTYDSVQKKIKSGQIQKDMSQFGKKTSVVGKQIKQASIKGFQKASDGLSSMWSSLSAMMKK